MISVCPIAREVILPGIIFRMDRAHISALVAGAVGAVIIAFSAIFVRLADVAPSVAAVYRCAYAIPLLIPIVVMEIRREGRPDRRAITAATIAGVWFAMDLVCWHISIGAVGAGLATVLANMQVVLIGLLAFVLPAQHITRRELAAIPIVMVGVLLIAGVLGTSVWGGHPTLGAITGLVTAASYTGFLLMMRRATPNPQAQAAPLLIATAVACACSLLVVPFERGASLAPTWPAHGWLVLLATTCQVLAWLLIARSLARLRPVVMSLLLTIQPIGSMVLGAIVLGERPAAAQLLGAALIVGAIILAVIGRQPPGSARIHSPTHAEPAPVSPD